MGDSSHGFVRDRRGCRHWGPHGAAGLLVRRGQRLLLQRRSWRVHHGRTWSVPGGALRAGESPWDGACREFAEEVGEVPPLRHLHTLVDDHGGWAYHTVVADLAGPEGGPDRAEPPRRRRGDGEGSAYRWCTVAEVGALRLHPGFAASWPALVAVLEGME
ncbi:NUDIX hydrolase [Kitasatospora cinereorecta]|uniref:NUDIX domain-containing protein n=1 Tax=Kitasatospora cinereorecta TaxID=285560 RepID=A0ABW0V3K8_9ACTN